jgi:hypothetical protein
VFRPSAEGAAEAVPACATFQERTEDNDQMKIQLTHEGPGQISTDLLVIILDSGTTLHDLTGSPVEETVRRIGRNIEDKRLKADYFTSLDGKGSAANLAIYATALSPNFNIWENV